MDPITIAAAFKAATTAIELAKKGVAFYKEVQATGGDIKDILVDLKEQYNRIVSPSKEQTKQYQEEVQRVQQVAQAKPADVLNDVWEQLGVFVDQYDLMSKAYIASETNAKMLYKGNVSLGRRALERLRLRHQLDAMLVEVREAMVYGPKELGDLWTRFEKMWMQIVAEQDAALAAEMRKIQAAKWQRNKAIQELKAKAIWIGAVVLITTWFAALLVLIRLSHTYRGLYSSPWWSCVLC